MNYKDTDIIHIAPGSALARRCYEIVTRTGSFGKRKYAEKEYQKIPFNTLYGCYGIGRFGHDDNIR